MKYNTILFDLDGTLTDSGIGITRSAAYALEKMGYPVPDQSVLDRFVGPPLYVAFQELTNLPEPDALRGVTIFRERYNEIGWRENRVYTGIAPLLKALKANGCYLAIASSKPAHFVHRIAEHFGFAHLFDQIIGTTPENQNAAKDELLLSALPSGCDLSGVAMIGDRKFDMFAAKNIGVTAIGALYGYGDREELANSGADYIAETPADLFDILLPGADRPRGRFITFEGADGCGKSTQMKLVTDMLSERGWEIISTREPGGCPFSEEVRELVLTPRYKGMSAEAEALLYAASRVEHLRQTILPALEAGKIVLCDRYLDSSFAYQAGGRELGTEFIRQINKVASSYSPDRTYLFVGDREKVSKRLRAGESLDRIEQENDSFVQRVYDGYEKLVEINPDRILRIASDRSIEEIFEDVRTDIDKILI